MARPIWLDGIDTFPVVTVPDDAADLSEQLGTKFKFWFQDADGNDVLFKKARINTGEHWSEKIACELCSLLGVPHAHYDLAVWRGEKGVVSPKFVGSDERLVHANELLFRIASGYDATNKFNNSYHTVKFVIRFLSSPASAIRPTLSCPTDRALTSAADVFVGYLLLDAWVGNTDRHHENWGIIISLRHGVRLAPSYDHAPCLGRIESDEMKRDVLTTSDRGRTLDSYATRARSALYREASDKKPLNPVDAFAEAARYRPAAAKYWVERLIGAQDNVDLVLELVPDSEMSGISKKFSRRLLLANRDRILNAMKELL